LLKKEADNISPVYLKKTNMHTSEDVQFIQGSIEYKMQYVARYDRDMFSEFMNRNSIDKPENIDPDKLADFNFRINRYMDEHAPDQTDLKKYIRIISTYLSFIAKKPLHPPGMILEDNQAIFKDGDNYYCPGKSKYILDELSLCKYCVCKNLK
jgi:uncharacterized protein (UPF0305 family)